MTQSKIYDAVVLGAGAAGLFYAAQAGALGLSVRVLDHSSKPAEKIRISGGGRCNFTNLGTRASCFLSQNPHFAKSALARYTPTDFLALMERHGLSWHEKTLGQLFCDQKSGAIIQMLLDEMESVGAELKLGVEIRQVRHADGAFHLETSQGPVKAQRLIVATGGLSIPKIGASSFAYDLARQFGHEVITPEPALVPLTFEGQIKEQFASLSGVATPVIARAGQGRFEEAMLFTHRGLSGPAILQVSSYWSPGEEIGIDLFAGQFGADQLKALKRDMPMKSLSKALETLLPKRLVDYMAQSGLMPDWPRLADVSHADLEALARTLSDWRLKPAGTEGWRTAEVTRGGVDTDGLSSKTMESRIVSNLYFIGECVDVTGWLGGYNFQWAWASAYAAAQASFESQY
ncbi:MAG: aminoacetone oxidase family FAD-binding enzyme [Oceanicaulis sp.]|uniref:NAD(P)/FAD-dependent oxidoreductase n=1 Tax=unclassified Oceanicaulis TaxID=2632123 RepID=UPI000C6A73E1|nr:MULTISPECIES: NAD(P)/FAD-dependent oxidoreductase [unclassified Oceanicaulis]MBC40044.1 aminoacetone oxidase family FAD-binding enzyme [Oceanicaulis sp.]MBG37104.1 aminoacetone oxidase family FAD-binding enzyme [Oceanicaulis sp.]|tara:strand:- start:351 stop:1559 length:1209 start_codon:yes stop_codon:yes gene_type:complete